MYLRFFRTLFYLCQQPTSTVSFAEVHRSWQIQTNDAELGQFLGDSVTSLGMLWQGDWNTARRCCGAALVFLPAWDAAVSLQHGCGWPGWKEAAAVDAGLQKFCWWVGVSRLCNEEGLSRLADWCRSVSQLPVLSSRLLNL